jgi:predicted esterase
MLGGGPDDASSVVTDFPTGEAMRGFRLMVPSHYDGSEPLPLVFGWHWLNASSSSFVREAEMESAIDQMNFIAVLPDAVRNDNGDRTFFLTWPFAEVWGYDAEMLFFDDMLACVTEQFNIDSNRIYGIGVSAGGLWLTTLATSERSEYFAAIEVLSGGLGDMLGVWRMEYMPQPNKFPAMVLWGGINDWLALSFHEASQRLSRELQDDNHFVVECTHDAGHGVPPVEPPPGDTKFRFLWRFMFDHPYTVSESPYLEDGLPDVFPDWCRIP